MAMTFSRSVLGTYGGYPGYLAHYKHVECNGMTYRVRKHYPENVSEAFEQSYVELMVKNLNEKGLGQQPGYKIPTHYGTFIVTCANEFCGSEYYITNVINRENANSISGAEFLNKYFDDNVKCIQICFAPAASDLD